MSRARGACGAPATGSAEHVDGASGFASEGVRLGGGPRSLAGAQRRRAHERGGHACDVLRIAERAGDALGHDRGSRRDVARHDDRPAAGQRLDRREPEALALRHQARDVAGAQPARHVRGATLRRSARASAMPRSRRSALELVALRAVADQRQRAATPLRARRGERREQSPDGSWRGTRLPTHATRGPSELPAERGDRDRGVAVDERARVSTPALTTCRRSPSGPRSPRAASPSSIRDGEDRARVGDGAQRRLADARRALGVRDVGAVRGERVRDAAARAARRAIVPVGTR